jgi:hypothetical protein
MERNEIGAKNNARPKTRVARNKFDLRWCTPEIRGVALGKRLPFFRQVIEREDG